MKAHTHIHPTSARSLRHSFNEEENHFSRKITFDQRQEEGEEEEEEEKKQTVEISQA